MKAQTFVSCSRMLLGYLLMLGALTAQADVVTEANARAAVIASRLPATPPAVRAMALVQVAVDRAVAVAGTQASVPAAVAAATRTVLLALLPNERAAIDADYAYALADIPDDASRQAGVAAGEQAANAVLGARTDDGAMHMDDYRPHTRAGDYVPTTSPAVPHWGTRRPWTLERGDQFRAGPPPRLDSALWTRDYNEIKARGARQHSTRTTEQTAAAKFWEASAPVVYWPVARAVAEQPSRSVAQNARFLARAAVAMDDALIAVFDGKYAFHFWRPITAIRNGDQDGNDATERDATWLPFIETPMHPEYPCAHCAVSAALGAVIAAEVGDGAMPRLYSASPTAPGVVRSWTRVEDFEREVAVARIDDGVHYRTSTEVGSALGRKVGAWAYSHYADETR
jgi:hypothetical protein